MIEATVLHKKLDKINYPYPYIAKSKSTERYVLFVKPQHMLVLKDDNNPKDSHGYDIHTDESFYEPFTCELLLKNK